MRQCPNSCQKISPKGVAPALLVPGHEGAHSRHPPTTVHEGDLADYHPLLHHSTTPSTDTVSSDRVRLYVCTPTVRTGGATHLR